MATENEPKPVYRYAFNDVVFDEARFELRVADQPVEIQPKTLEVLLILLRTVDEMVSQDQMIRLAWPGRTAATVSDNIVNVQLNKLRAALGEHNSKRIITVPRTGYRFDGPLTRRMIGRQFVGRMSLAAGMPVLRHEDFVLEEMLGRSRHNETWRARNQKTGETRVYKFCADGRGLDALRREAALFRALNGSLHGRTDIICVTDADFLGPTFLLEYEDGGRNLNEWAEAGSQLQKLAPAQRVDLFLRIADAIAAAHSIGVLHKDLKPANILVSPGFDGLQIKIGDFGSGRLIDPEHREALGLDEIDATITRGISGDSGTGTPQYLAPELFDGQPATMQSDVYALGILLYQIAAGDLNRRKDGGWECDIVDQLLREDIDAATQGNPVRRLAGVAELADRVRRLDARRDGREQVQAAERAAAATREALKRSRARRPWVIAAMTSLAVGLTASLALYHESRSALSRAEKEAARAQAINQFLDDDLLGAADPSSPGGAKDIKVADILSRAAGNLKSRFTDDPATKAAIDLALGNTYFGISDYANAELFQTRAVELLRTSLGESDDVTLEAEYRLSRTLGLEGRHADVDALLDRADHAAGARLGESSSLALLASWSRGNDALMLMQPERALPAFETAERIRPAVATNSARWLFKIRGNLAWCYVRLGRDNEAIDSLRELISPRYPLETLGAVDWTKVRLEYAMALNNKGNFDDAERVLNETLQQTKRVLGDEHYFTGLVWNHLGTVYATTRRWDAAIDAQQKAYAIMRKRIGEDGQATLGVAGELAATQYQAGHVQEALPMLHAAHAALAGKLGRNAALTQDVAFYLSAALAQTGHSREASLLSEELLPSALNAVDPSSDWDQRLLGLKGMILQGEGKADEARPLLESALHDSGLGKASSWMIGPLRDSMAKVSGKLQKNPKGRTPIARPPPLQLQSAFDTSRELHTGALDKT